MTDERSWVSASLAIALVTALAACSTTRPTTDATSTPVPTMSVEETGRRADDLVDRVAALDGVSEVRPVGSRARGDPTPLSDWDYEVDVTDFEAVAAELPGAVAPLGPLAVFWDPLGSPVSSHGVTTVVMGNCGFTLAPCRESEAYLALRSLERAGVVERSVDGVPTYRLTDCGQELAEVCLALGKWGARWREVLPEHHDPYLVVWLLSRMIHLDELPRRRVVVRFDVRDGRPPNRLWLVMSAGEREVCVTDPRYGDDAVVMRDGRVVGAAPLAGLSRAEIVRLMVGRDAGDFYAKTAGFPGGEVLRGAGRHRHSLPASPDTAAVRFTALVAIHPPSTPAAWTADALTRARRPVTLEVMRPTTALAPLAPLVTLVTASTRSKHCIGTVATMMTSLPLRSVAMGCNGASCVRQPKHFKLSCP